MEQFNPNPAHGTPGYRSDGTDDNIEPESIVNTGIKTCELREGKR